eukprot:TRINITY_DN6694_c0_g1_i1.p1 TRINITY_DN6694_c0_g1~~TRINITY_DN6694_c0_g1_i1.p1  ORF type:complete len:1383 (+),score=279.45 TRINITY_DN6694_c0_g1_i1:74-4150(+)
MAKLSVAVSSALALLVYGCFAEEMQTNEFLKLNLATGMLQQEKVGSKPEHDEVGGEGQGEGKEEEEEDVHAGESRAISLMLLGSVGFIMGNIMLVNLQDVELRCFAWEVISCTVSIFSAVLVFQAVNGFVESLVMGFGSFIKIVVAILHMGFWMVLLQVKLGHAAGAHELLGYTDPCVEKHQELQQESKFVHRDIAESKTHAYDAIEMNLKCWSTLLGHVAGFATINAFGHIQQTAKHSIVGALAVPLLTCAFLVVVFHIFFVYRHRVAENDDNHIDEYEKLWFAEVSETEDDIFGLAISFLVVQAIRFVINGALPSATGEDKEGTVHTFVNIVLLMGVGIGLILLHVLRDSIYTLKWKRLGNCLRDTCCMSFAWCLYYSTWEATSQHLFVPGQEASAAVVTALVVSSLSMLCVYHLDKLADFEATNSEVHDSLRSAIFAFPILIGFSWERSFDLAVEKVADLMMIWSVSFTKLLLALLLAAVVIPVWKTHILKSVRIATTQADHAKALREAAEREGAQPCVTNDLSTPLLPGERSLVTTSLSTKSAQRSDRRCLLSTDFGLSDEEVSQLLQKHHKAHVIHPPEDANKALFSVKRDKLKGTKFWDSAETAIGVSYRKSKEITDSEDYSTARWDTSVMGVDTGDGWVQVKHFLPIYYEGTRVLENKATGEQETQEVLSQTLSNTREPMLVGGSQCDVDDDGELRAEQAREMKLLLEQSHDFQVRLDRLEQPSGQESDLKRFMAEKAEHLQVRLELLEQGCNKDIEPCDQEGFLQRRVAELEVELRNMQEAKKNDEMELNDNYQRHIVQLNAEVEHARKAQEIHEQAHNTNVVRVTELQGELDILHQAHMGKIQRIEELERELGSVVEANSNDLGMRELENNHRQQVAELENEHRLTREKHGNHMLQVHNEFEQRIRELEAKHHASGQSDSASQQRIADLSGELHLSRTNHAEAEACAAEFKQALEEEKLTVDGLRQNIIEFQKKESDNVELEKALTAHRQRNEELEQIIAKLKDELADGAGGGGAAQQLREQLNINEQEMMDLKRNLDVRNHELEMNFTRREELEKAVKDSVRNEAMLNSRLEEYKHNLNVAEETKASIQARTDELQADLARFLQENEQLKTDFARLEDGHASAMSALDSEIQELKEKSTAQRSAAVTHAQRGFDLQNTATKLTNSLAEREEENKNQKEEIEKLRERIQALEMMLRDCSEANTSPVSPTEPFRASTGGEGVVTPVAPAGSRRHTSAGRRIAAQGGPRTGTSQGVVPISVGASDGRASTAQPVVKAVVLGTRRPGMAQPRPTVQPIRRQLQVAQTNVLSPQPHASQPRTSTSPTISSFPGNTVVSGSASARRPQSLTGRR